MEELAIARLLHQSRQAELPVGSGEWLLAVIGAVAARPPVGPPKRMSFQARRAALEEKLREKGLAYGTGAQDSSVEVGPEAAPGERAFAHFVGGLVRLCAKAAAVSQAGWFVPGSSHEQGVRARRAQLLAVLAAAGGEAEAAARLFADPLAIPGPVEKLADRTAARLARRFLRTGGPFAGLPLHNGLCAVEARACGTLALAAFGHGRISPGAVALISQAALGSRGLLVELLAGLARSQDDGGHFQRGMEQVIRAQRLPVREARALRAALAHPREIEQVAPALHSEALRRFMLTQVLLAALMDGQLEAGEFAFVERLSRAIGVDGAALSELEAEVAAFYRDHSALTAADKVKIREQLIDLAKTIPALAIFAAPGGMLLLPILFKLLPFNLLPSSFTDPPPARPALPQPRRKSG